MGARLTGPTWPYNEFWIILNFFVDRPNTTHSSIFQQIWFKMNKKRKQIIMKILKRRNNSKENDNRETTFILEGKRPTLKTVKLEVSGYAMFLVEFHETGFEK